VVGSGAGRSVDPRWSAATFSPSALNYAVDPRHASAHTAPSQHPPVAPPAGLLDGLLLQKQTHARSSEVRGRHLASGRRGPQRSEDTHRPAGGRVLITDGGGFSNKPERISIVV
jgi:hypothetical protein